MRLRYLNDKQLSSEKWYKFPWLGGFDALRLPYLGVVFWKQGVAEFR